MIQFNNVMKSRSRKVNKIQKAKFVEIHYERLGFGVRQLIEEKNMFLPM